MMDSINNLSPGRDAKLQTPEYLVPKHQIYNLEKKSRKINLNSSNLSNMSNISRGKENVELKTYNKHHRSSPEKDSNKIEPDLVCHRFKAEEVKTCQRKLEVNSELGSLTQYKDRPPRNDHSTNVYFRNVKKSSIYNYDYSKDYESLHCNGANDNKPVLKACIEEKINDKEFLGGKFKINSEKTRNRSSLYSCVTEFSSRNTQSEYDINLKDRENKTLQILDNLENRNNVINDLSYIRELNFKKNLQKELVEYNNIKENENLAYYDYKNDYYNERNLENEKFIKEISLLLGTDTNKYNVLKKLKECLKFSSFCKMKEELIQKISSMYTSLYYENTTTQPEIKVLWRWIKSLAIFKNDNQQLLEAQRYKNFCEKLMKDNSLKNLSELNFFIEELLSSNNKNHDRVEKIKRLLMTEPKDSKEYYAIESVLYS